MPTRPGRAYIGTRNRPPVEGSNLITAPNDFSAAGGGSAAWNLFGDTVTNNTTVAPDGTTTAATIALPATANFHQHNTTNLTPGAGQYKARIFIKPGVNVDFVGLTDPSGAGVVFQLSTQQVKSLGTATSGSILAVANGFYRLETVCSLPAAAIMSWRVSATQGNAALGVSYTPGGSDTAFAWGAYFGTFR